MVPNRGGSCAERRNKNHDVVRLERPHDDDDNDDDDGYGGGGGGDGDDDDGHV